MVAVSRAIINLLQRLPAGPLAHQHGSVEGQGSEAAELRRLALHHPVLLVLTRGGGHSGAVSSAVSCGTRELAGACPGTRTACGRSLRDGRKRVGCRLASAPAKCTALQDARQAGKSNPSVLHRSPHVPVLHVLRPHTASTSAPPQHTFSFCLPFSGFADWLVHLYRTCSAVAWLPWEWAGTGWASPVRH